MYYSHKIRRILKATQGSLYQNVRKKCAFEETIPHRLEVYSVSGQQINDQSDAVSHLVHETCVSWAKAQVSQSPEMKLFRFDY